MRIQIRHALGAEEIDLPARGVGEAMIVGQGNDAYIKIPSLEVKRRHCAIFFHKGQWAIQDLSGGLTFLNSGRLMQPNRLKVGYKIRLGEDPKAPRIQIVSITPEVETAAAAGIVSQEEVTDASSLAVGDPRIVEPADDAAEPTGDGWESASDAGMAANWSSAPARPGAPRSEMPRGKSYSTEGAMTIGIIAMIVVVVGGGLAVWGLLRHADKRSEKPKEIVIHETVVIPAPAPTPSSPRKNIFDPSPGAATGNAPESGSPFGGVPTAVNPIDDPSLVPTATAPFGTGPTTTTAPTTASASANSKSAAPDEAAIKAAAAEDAWVEIDRLHESFKWGPLIWSCEHYIDTKPTSPLLGAAKKYRDEGFDSLWWERIGDILEQTDKLKESAKSYRDEIAATPNLTADARAALERSAKDNDDQAAFNYRLLANDMSWSSQEKPPVDDEGKLAEARQKRDTTKYNEWCTRLREKLNQTRGARLPWDSK